ncbi:hypothetical protein KP509_35G064400 [Ceratopteris richardii]|nr:hypothetical protein KP509_35G064400 [Ceratopteris richardii]
MAPASSKENPIIMTECVTRGAAYTSSETNVTTIHSQLNCSSYIQNTTSSMMDSAVKDASTACFSKATISATAASTEDDKNSSTAVDVSYLCSLLSSNGSKSDPLDLSIKCQGDFMGSGSDGDSVDGKGACGIVVSSDKTTMASSKLNQTSECSTSIMSDDESHASNEKGEAVIKTSTSCSVMKTLSGDSKDLCLMTNLTTNCSSISKSYTAGTRIFFKCCTESSTEIVKMDTENENGHNALDEGLLSPFIETDVILL